MVSGRRERWCDNGKKNVFRKRRMWGARPTDGVCGSHPTSARKVAREVTHGANGEKLDAILPSNKEERGRRTPVFPLVSHGYREASQSSQDGGDKNMLSLLGITSDLRCCNRPYTRNRGALASVPNHILNHTHTHLKVGGAKRDPVLPPAQRYDAEREDDPEEDRSGRLPAQEQHGADGAEEPDERGVRRVEEAAAAVEERVEHAGRDHRRDPEEGDASHDEVAQVRSALLVD